MIFTNDVSFMDLSQQRRQRIAHRTMILDQTVRRLHGAPTRTRRPIFHAPRRSDTKEGKDRFSLKEAIVRDRERIERNKTLPWKERLEQLKVYPWKTFICFMVCWSWLGTYAVPYLKGHDQNNTTMTRQGQQQSMRVTAAYDKLLSEKEKHS